MNDDAMPGDLVARALSGLDERVGPSELERARARRRFEAMLDDSFEAAQPDGVELQGLAELPRMTDAGRRPNRSRWLVAAAACLVLVWTGVAIFLSSGEQERVDVQSPTPDLSPSTPTTTLPANVLTLDGAGSVLEVGRYRVALADRQVSFEIDQPVEIVGLSERAIVLVPTAADRGEGERIGLVADEDLFGGSDPEAWISALGVTVQTFGRSVDGVGRVEYSVSQSAGDCQLYTVCPPLSAAVPEVGINAGGQTRVVPLLDDGLTPIALVSTYQNVPSDGPMFRLWNSIATTLDLER